MTTYFAVIEAGGTKFNCAIMDGDKNIVAETRIPTTTPQETIGATIAFFKQQQGQYAFSKLGLACFGPLDLETASSTFGNITATPKPDWSNTPIRQQLMQALGVDVIIDTDVNGAALAEYLWGAAQGVDVAIYITVGTGVGGGVVINGKPLHGLVHPEIGHILVPDKHNVKCACPFHDNCVEGLASGSSIAKIWDAPGETLSDEHQAWEVATDALAHMCHNLLMTLSPNKIVLGGGVMAKPGLLDKVVAKTNASLAGYLTTSTPLNEVIVAPQLGGISGLYGALALAM
ncbi:ROK family protein [Neptunicella marina]|uniref:fructokinase n=1 Tax=Neptunicella marina TaxID=2125989 RepID=A0A8J6IXT0_9ALTE|nr:ROK family protein [Neptunicella marina]MBC3767415.1 ROK family protein [Neptunicella marina]